jgi:hypothetical protein
MWQSVRFIRFVYEFLKKIKQRGAGVHFRVEITV